MSLKKTYFFFLPNFDKGGAGNSIYKICKNLSSQNKIIVISLGSNSYKKEFSKLKIKIIELPHKRVLTAIFSIKNIINNYLNKKKKKIVFISNINYSNAICCIFLKSFKKFKNFKLILFERTPIQELETYKNLYEFIKRSIIRYLIKKFYKEADYVIGNSKNVSKDLQNLCNRKVLTFNPFVEKNKSIRKNNKVKKILWIGRLSYEKNISDLIASLSYLEDEKFKLTIISNPILDLKKIHLSKKNENKIFVKSFNSNQINNFYKKSDILISTSIYEGFPNVIAEAISNNCLIITSNSYGGVNDLVKNKNCGYFYKKYDSRDLSNKIKKALNNTQENQIKIKNARSNLLKIRNKNKEFKIFLENIK